MYKHTLGRTAAWLAGILIAGSTTLAIAGPDDDWNQPDQSTDQTMGEMHERMHGEGMQGQGMQGQGMQGQGMQGQRQSTQLSGRVLALKRVQIRGTQQTNLVALVETQQGARRIVDLGPRTQARQLDLQVGDQLRVRGFQAQVHGRSVLIADRASAGDETIWIDRSMQRRQLQQKMRQMSDEDMDTCPRCSQQ